MIYSDENIVAMIREAKKKRRLALQNHVTIGETTYNFAVKELFDGLFSVIMPESFIAMPNKAAQEKYPSIDRPQIIYTNDNATVNVTFSYTEYHIQSTEIENCIKGFKLVIKRMYPANKFYDLICEHLNSSMLGYFDYRSYALDDDLYNVMYITSIEGNLLIGTFSCLFIHKAQWNPCVKQMMQSISDLREEYNKHE